MPTPLIKPTFLPCPWAANGDKNVIPESGADLGYASWAMGWGVINQTDLAAGGIPPYRTDFNGALFALSSHLMWLQSGGMYEWAATLDYPARALIWASDGKLYLSLQPSGPGTEAGPQNPTAEGSADYWRQLDTSGKRQENRYELCEFYSFRHPTLRPGFQPAQGGVLQNAAEQYPEAWAYLQTAEGQKLCKTEVDWQAMSTATWYTLADGTKVGWEGIGGVPYYVQDLNTGSLRLPDLRGMYAEAAGFDGLDAGGVHGDGSRPITGSVNNEGIPDTPAHFGATVWQRNEVGALYQDGNHGNFFSGGVVGEYGSTYLYFDSGRVAPTAAKTQPRAWGALACCYLGQRAS